MSSELAMNAYVLLGNALHCMLRAGPRPEERVPIAALAGKIEPLSPSQILPGLAALSEEERTLLSECVLRCIAALGEAEVLPRLGLPEEVIRATLRELGL